MQNVVLFFAGSFYPIHINHLNMIFSAQHHFTKKGFNVQKTIVAPSHFGSLEKKFTGIEKKDDYRQCQLLNFLRDHENIEINFDLMNSDTNVGLRKFVADLKNYYVGNGSKFIQICGVDSQISFAQNNNNVLVINTGRIIPENNKRIIQKSSVIHTFFENSPTSSTIERYISHVNRENIYPIATIANFDVKWLYDSGIVLGQGVQGVVRLMFLGNKEVAVKVYTTKPNEISRFNYEVEMYNILNYSGVVPRIYASGIIVNDNISYIVMDACIPINKMFNIAHYYKDKPTDKQKRINNEAMDIFLQYVNSHPASYENTETCKIESLLKNKYTVDPVSFKKLAIENLISCVSNLRDYSIFHKDISANNILIGEDCKIFLIDFGIARKSKDPCKLRGSIRYYPVASLNDRKYYNYWCDMYLTSIAIYEIIEQHEIYPECNGCTPLMVEKRQNKHHPGWSNNNLLLYENEIRAVNNIWNEHDSMF